MRNVVLGFAPYIAFFLVMRAVSVDAGLWAAAGVAVLNTGWHWGRSRSVKVLEAGSVVLFVVLAAATTVGKWHWTVMRIRLVVDAGLLAIVLVSIAIGRPFTLQYAREMVPRQYQNAPLLFAVNQRITWAWAGAFAAMVAAHAAVVYEPGVLVLLDVGVTVIASAGAVWFTKWYPEHARKRAVSHA